VFVGLSINPQPDRHQKRQNKIPVPAEPARLEEGRGIVTATTSSASRTTRRIDLQGHQDHQRAALDILGFTLLCPLPGSEDHKVLWEKASG
jgi:hypothetical protein